MRKILADTIRRKAEARRCLAECVEWKNHLTAIFDRLGSKSKQDPYSDERDYELMEGGAK